MSMTRIDRPKAEPHEIEHERLVPDASLFAPNMWPEARAQQRARGQEDYVRDFALVTDAEGAGWFFDLRRTFMPLLDALKVEMAPVAADGEPVTLGHENLLPGAACRNEVDLRAGTADGVKLYQNFDTSRLAQISRSALGGGLGSLLRLAYLGDVARRLNSHLRDKGAVAPQAAEAITAMRRTYRGLLAEAVATALRLADAQMATLMKRLEDHCKAPVSASDLHEHLDDGDARSALDLLRLKNQLDDLAAQLAAGPEGEVAW
jgi:hypothetical protein